MPSAQDNSKRIPFSSLEEGEKKVLTLLACHPWPASLDFLLALTGESRESLPPLLESLQKKNWIHPQKTPIPAFQLSGEDARRGIFEDINDAELQSLHRRILDHLSRLPNPDHYAPMLGFHAGEAHAWDEAFHWTALTAEYFASSGAWDKALEFLERAASFSRNPLQGAILEGRRADFWIGLDRFEEARLSFREALRLARESGWTEGSFDYCLSLAHLCRHLARFKEAEGLYRQAIQNLPKEAPAGLHRVLLQNLGETLIELAQYSEALKVIQECLSLMSSGGSPLERVIAMLHLTRVHLALNEIPQAEGRLRIAEGEIQHEKLSVLLPHFAYLKGRVDLMQRRFAAAFRIFENAARGFEEKGDLAGKVDVLLTISAALIEYGLVRDADGLVDQVVLWEDLKKFPALAHAVHLRRLVLDAFLGRWLPEDVHSLEQDSFEIGRKEDWMQFWFHLSLACRRLGRVDWIGNFLAKARKVGDEIFALLSPEQQKTFLQRPDMARIWRMTQKKEASIPGEKKIRALRSLPSAESVDAASLAPPSVDKGKDEE